MSELERIQSAATLVLPEITLLLTVCVMFLVAPFLTTTATESAHGLRSRWGVLTLLGLGVALLLWWYHHPVSDGLGPFHIDGLAWFTRGAMLTLGLVLTLVLWNQVEDQYSAEMYACLLAMIAGVNLTACANDLVELFLALELVSIPTYVLLYLSRRDRDTREAAIKYFLLSLFSSAIFLFGASWFFGATGTTHFAGIVQATENGRLVDTAMVRMALLFMIAGLGFRVTAVPFHFYAPDVFQGVTSSAAAVLSLIPKVVGFVALLRLLSLASGVLLPESWLLVAPAREMLAVVAVATMFVGNLLALRQRNLHRLLAWSSVAHAGYMLAGLAVGNHGTTASGTAALLFYLVVYGFMTIGVFALLAGTGAQNQSARVDSDLAGLGRTQPLTALLLTVCLFSLIGLPPTAGFLAKLNLFLATWSDGTWLGQSLASAMAINAAIAAWYYLRLISMMYLEPVRDDVPSETLQSPAWIAGLICVAATIGLFVLPQFLWDAALRAVG